jgi:hypothetical protein
MGGTLCYWLELVFPLIVALPSPGLSVPICQSGVYICLEKKTHVKSQFFSQAFSFLTLLLQSAFMSASSSNKSPLNWQSLFCISHSISSKSLTPALNLAPNVFSWLSISSAFMCTTSLKISVNIPTRHLITNKITRETSLQSQHSSL